MFLPRSNLTVQAGLCGSRLPSLLTDSLWAQLLEVSDMSMCCFKLVLTSYYLTRLGQINKGAVHCFHGSWSWGFLKHFLYFFTHDQRTYHSMAIAPLSPVCLQGKTSVNMKVLDIELVQEMENKTVFIVLRVRAGRESRFGIQILEPY